VSAFFFLRKLQRTVVAAEELRCLGGSNCRFNRRIVAPPSRQGHAQLAVHDTFPGQREVERVAHKN